MVLTDPEYFTRFKMPVFPLLWSVADAKWVSYPIHNLDVKTDNACVPKGVKLCSHKEVFWEEQGSLPKEGNMA